MAAGLGGPARSGSGTYTYVTVTYGTVARTVAVGLPAGDRMVGMTATDTQASVVDSTGFLPLGLVGIDAEVLTYSGIASNTLSALVRGLGGTSAWTQLSQLGTPPGPRGYHSAVFDAANQRMILLGGRNDSENPYVTNRVWVLILNHAPTAICHDVTVSAGPDCTANASIDNGSFDPDSGDTITLMQSPSGPYPLGATQVTLTVTDNHGASSQSTATVTVIDNTPPSFTTGPTVDKPVLWPPDHKMVDVTVDCAATDNCSAPLCTLSVASNEPVNGTGDGDMAPDWEIVDAHHLRLRAERAGAGSARVYTITINCVDFAGNATSKTVTVSVPKSQK